MRNSVSALLIAAGFLLVFVGGFLLRATDDNSLFSWSWAFANVDASRIYLFLIAGLVSSFFLSAYPLPDRYRIPALAFISFMAIVPLWQESEIIIDASRYFTQAKHLELYGFTYFFREWGREIVAWTDLPLVPFLYGMLFRICGEHRIVIQIFTSVLFSLTTVLTCLIGQKLWDRETGFSAGLLLLGIPYLLLQVPLMLVDVPTMFFLTLSAFTFLSAVSGKGRLKSASAVAAVVCTILAKYSAWFMLSVLVVILVVYAFQAIDARRRSIIVKGMGILFVSAVIAFLLLLLKGEVVSKQVALLLDYQRPGLARWGETLYSTFFFQVHPFITLLALASIVLAIRNRDAKQLIVMWLLLLVVVFGVRRIRYTLPVFPMLALMAGYGLQAVKKDEMRRFIVYGVVSSSLVIAFLAYLPFAKNMSASNLKLAGEYLNTLKTDEIDVRIVAPLAPAANFAASVPLLDFFTSKRICYDYRTEDATPPADVETSSLRFTWEYRNPKYYSSNRDAKCNEARAVISGVPPERLPAPLLRELKTAKPIKTFASKKDIFQLGFSIQIFQ